MEINKYFIDLEKRLKVPAAEIDSIKTSTDYLKQKIWGVFQDKLRSVEIFGSYDRGTKLPSEVNQDTDVDILIVFKKNEFQPRTYLNQLRAFGERTYPRSDIFPDHPSIIVELAHLRFDLVPAYVETGFFGDETIYIPGPPSKDLKWIETDPTSFKKQLVEKNNDKNGLTISIIKIMKYWNCINNYPFSSFFLERVAVKNNVSGKNLKECFYDFISEISDYNLTDFQAKVFNPLKDNKRKLKILEEQNIPNYIQQELASFIPIPA